MRTPALLLGALLVVWLAQGESIDLRQRYPTQLTNGVTTPDKAYPWKFTSADVFRLSRFTFEVGDSLKIESGPADLGIGHCSEGAVWAVVLPRTLATLTRQRTNSETVAHVWLRFHPQAVNQLFPPDSVFNDGTGNVESHVRAVAQAKFTSSWHAGMKAMIPERKDITVDLDTQAGPRRFFAVDTAAQSVRYIAAFENRAMPRPPAFDAALATQAFDSLWEAFDREYAMFGLRPEVDWDAARERFRPRALACRTTDEFATVCAEMLRPLRDLHIWMTVAGVNVPVFDRPRSANANPSAHAQLLGQLQSAGRVQWTVTPDRIGFLAIHGWEPGPEIPNCVDAALESLRDTRGLILDVRLNGGGDEATAGQVAGRFLEREFVYAFSQYRNGRAHTNLTQRFERKVRPRGPWRYAQPVVVLMGQRCMSSNDSFLTMLSGAPRVTLMGDRSCGSSGNPRILKLPLDLTVSLPRWIDYLPDGRPLDERGVQPQIQFQPIAGAFEGDRDDLLTAALAHLRRSPAVDKTPAPSPVH